MLRRTGLSVAALAAATLLLESTLTRLLAVAQFYHFAFLVVSLALLGFGASGTLLSLAPRVARIPPDRILALGSGGFVASTALAYAAINLLPFDSYRIAWERSQIAYFALYYLALTLPFVCGGLGIGAALAGSRGRSHQVYASNLLGSAVGALLAPVALGLAGVPGAVLASALIAWLPVMTWHPARISAGLRWSRVTVLGAGVVGVAILAGLNLGNRGPLGLELSPYKGLSYARRYPGSTHLFGRWNAVSRVDVMGDAGTRLLPGLSYTYAGPPPEQLGLSVDADAMAPIPLTSPTEFAAAPYMPEALAFQLRPAANALVIEPAGGLGILQALAGGARQVTAVTGNPLAPAAVAATTSTANLYAEPRVHTVTTPPRGYIRRETTRYDVVFLPLTDAYRPVTSGAYGLAETYGLTVEAFADLLARLEPDGILVVTRWLQTPPSEDLRLIATLAEALERRGSAEPANALVAYRGIQTLTSLVRPAGWTSADLAKVRDFTEARRYDIVWAPDVQETEVNRFNRMPTAVYYRAVAELLTRGDRSGFYRDYPFAVTPPTDDRPFFFHFFRWAQTPQVLATLGRTWQPFGGSGYFVLFAVLSLVLVLSGLLIVAPLALAWRRSDRAFRAAAGAAVGSRPGRGRGLAYFGVLGIAFLFVEIPLIQRWLLVFGHATYSFTLVVLTLLLGSSVGSALARSKWLPKRAAVAVLALLATLTAIAGRPLVEAALSWPELLRAAACGLSLAPVAVLMGLPFPLGLVLLESDAPELVSWAWAVNGCLSVVASVTAAILTLSYGFTAVILLGALGYAVAAALLPRQWDVVNEATDLKRSNPEDTGQVRKRADSASSV